MPALETLFRQAEAQSKAAFAAGDNAAFSDAVGKMDALICQAYQAGCRDHWVYALDGDD